MPWRAAEELEIALNVWTVNDPAEIVRLAAVGVDAIITDTPRLARQHARAGECNRATARRG